MEGDSSHWCHMCSRTVNPLREVELKCPVCLSGFVEEMDSPSRRLDESEIDLPSESSLALWAPILLGMLDGTRIRQGVRSQFLDENSTEDENEDGERTEGETEIDRELDVITRRRRRSTAAVLQLLQGLSAGISSESENRERERLILYNPFNQTILVQGSDDSNHDQNSAQNSFVSVSDYFAGPDLDLLQQLLAENDPNRYGTPPAQKEAVDSLTTVEVEENVQCPVCLDDFEASAEAKEMPCKHKFHSGCLLPWLELHSSCPVCRFQLPADESKRDAAAPRGSGEVRDVEEQGGSESSFTFPWPLSALSSSSRQRGNSSRSPSASSSGGPGAGSQADGN